jgi:hypothetical protein
MSDHFTPEGPYTNGGNFTHTNANNIEDGIEAVDDAKADLAGATFTGAVEVTAALTTNGKAVVVVGTHNGHAFTLSVGTSLPGTLDAYEIFVHLS